jgi:hypothetical protein
MASMVETTFKECLYYFDNMFPYDLWVYLEASVSQGHLSSSTRAS